jgi:hypothetical protein
LENRACNFFLNNNYCKSKQTLTPLETHGGALLSLTGLTVSHRDNFSNPTDNRNNKSSSESKKYVPAMPYSKTNKKGTAEAVP